MGYSKDAASLISILILLGIPIILAVIYSYISSYIEEKVKNELQKKESLFTANLSSIRHKFMRDLEEITKKMSTLIDLYSNIEIRISNNVIGTRKWLANYITEAKRASDLYNEEYLINKKYPALKASDILKKSNEEKREYLKKLTTLKYQLETYEEYFPFLKEYEEEILNDDIDFSAYDSYEKIDKNYDRRIEYLSKEEYNKLSESEKSQVSLERYLSKRKTNIEIGRLYERYIGYLYEIKGWDVTYHGAIKGFEDLGRDLICRKDGNVEIIQAKCWSQNKMIHEKHIFQLYGTKLLYDINSKNEISKGVFTTTAKVSDFAKYVANELEIEVRESQHLDDGYPMIKCNINGNERIYHLPFDQQYDRIKIDMSAGELYVHTANEAEHLGFRRAKRFLLNSTL